MTVKLDFEECLKDSPRFRAAIETVEGEVTDLETRLEKLVKQYNVVLESNRVCCSNSRQFVTSIRELSQHSKKDAMLMDCLEKFSSKLSGIIDAQMGLIESTQKSVKQQLQNFVKDDVKKFKDTKKEFDKSSEALETALNRNAQAPRNKVHEVEDASTALLNARKTFRGEALDYVLQINVIESKKKTEVLSSMLALMEAQATFFAEGHDSLKQLENYRQQLAEQLHQLVLNSAREKRDMEQRHTMVKQKDISFDDSMVEFSSDAPNGIAMEGYLYKRASNAFKTWSRRWFSIQKNQLVYQKKLKDTVTVVVEDLRLCTVKSCPDLERRFCFEVVSPSKSCLLQADSEKQQQAWMLAVQNSIATAFQEQTEDLSISRLERTSSTSAGSVGGMDLAGQRCEGVDKKVLEQVQRIPGNAQCCDCGEPNPDWASINLGITLCIVCSGIHRSLGVHFSKVRSLTLDSWEPELMKLMCELGNSTINRIYEARIDEMTIKKPHPGSPRQDKDSWIRSKYVEKKFIQKLPEMGSRLRRSSARRNWASTDKVSSKPALKPKPGRATLPRPGGAASNQPASGIGIFSSSTSLNSSHSSLNSATSWRDIDDDFMDDKDNDLSALHPGALLYRAAAMQNFPVMADALAHGADVNWVNNNEGNRTPLIQAVSVDSLVACEFLLQNGANVNQKDSLGHSPLHHATILGHTGLVCLFLKRGADQQARDENGKDPLTIAIDNANADIVTLLRLAKMKEEMMQETEGIYGQPGQCGDHRESIPSEGQQRKSFQALMSQLAGWATGSSTE
ncbi:arf-GAP with coiled-coil, ANK repeat and PH domain-containing protein 1 isoform X1 [Erpetoichthys calabaricus]|uniref:arf-GAP with coiled-coil, ANK repeat and PH domain-containing protein 1 isoform X1 n=1 Tax=Erpetoichthys calabaricus TaxID=27687 RepID=UPI002234BA5F|nr:arf-GAP with coiled-coil, ANK repeat and PH domain-containing protein 1 isoform X1 [Erpetoichthys calabaricus]